jgi:HNH endonuclease
MATRSPTLAALSREEREALEKRLLSRQSGKCFICDMAIDLHVHRDQLDIDHIQPLSEEGKDEENNFALTHASCNRSKGASDLRVARRMAAFQKLQDEAQKQGERGANLGHLLTRYGGALYNLRTKRDGDAVQYAFAENGDNVIRTASVHRDPLSGMEYFFGVFPLSYLHHDDRINPRSIGFNIRGLIEEFMRKRPQLHVALGWFEDSDAEGKLKIFDGQHKAAAQILLGVRELPVRVFLNPDTNVLLQANTNAGDKLRQVAFDSAVLRHLGSTLYSERMSQYRQMKNLSRDDYSFSERDLVNFFKGEHREVQRYIVDSVRDGVNYHKDNRLREFVEWAGKKSDRPLAYTSIERTFFAEFLYKKTLDVPIGLGVETGENPRLLEHAQIVRLMNLFADIFFVGKWDPEVGGRRLETRLQKGEEIPEHHLRAWRVAREEVLAVILEYVRNVTEHYFAMAGEFVERDRIMQHKIPERLWEHLETFLTRMSELPCWIDKNLSITVFGAKQNRDFWKQVFKTGRAPTGVQVLTKPIDVVEMIKS